MQSIKIETNIWANEMVHWARSALEELLWENKSVSQRLKSDTLRIIDLLEKRSEHEFRTSKLEKLADNISLCENFSELSELMYDLSAALGFEHFAVFVIKESIGDHFDPKICTSYPRDWIENYVQNSYQFVDPVMTKAAAADDDTFLFSDLEARTPGEQRFWDDAKKHRVGREGVCSTLTRSNGTRIGLSFSSRKTQEQVRDLLQSNLYDLKFLSELVADAFCYFACGPILADDTLTLDELRFLQVLSTSPNPDDALKISGCFGSNETLQASIRTKLKVESVFQAIAIAASRGWFCSLPYCAKEISKPFSPLVGLHERT